MSAHEKRRWCQCLMPGCVSGRWANSGLCSGHWRRLTMDERRHFTSMLCTMGAAALAGDQQALDDAIVDAEAWLGRIAPEMPSRPMTPVASER